MVEEVEEVIQAVVEVGVKKTTLTGTEEVVIELQEVAVVKAVERSRYSTTRKDERISPRDCKQ
jgi:hypothetical protein